jgi:arylsulfatase A-like enzyme
MPQILKEHGVHTQLISDHLHYWEDGGATYHNRYSCWEVVRGQEGDYWKGDLRPIEIPDHIGGRGGNWGRQDWVNRTYMKTEAEHNQTITFDLGEQFLRANARQDNWLLHLETFDPHEPYFTYEKYKKLYPHDYTGPLFDWPDYDRVKETPEQVQHLRYQYAALVSMCDHSLGRILNLMDELNLWEDTLLIVHTDHGFLLSEHDWWGKCVQPFYNEIAHIPMFIWDPRRKLPGCRRSTLVQTIDIAPTLLDFYGVPIPPDMQGHPIWPVIENDTPLREAGIYGVHGGHVNVTDGRFVYMRAPTHPENTPLYNYTLMPTHMRSLFTVKELQDIQLAEPFTFSKGCHLMKIAGEPWMNPHPFGTMLFDLIDNPSQLHPISDPVIENQMIQHLRRLMQENDAPPEQYERLGL